MSSFSPRFRTHALALDFPTLCRPFDTILPYPELNSQRKRSMKGVPVAKIRREKRARTDSARCEISNVSALHFFNQTFMPRVCTQRTSGEFYILNIHARAGDVNFLLRSSSPFTFCVFALRLSLHPRAFEYWRDLCPFSPFLHV